MELFDPETLTFSLLTEKMPIGAEMFGLVQFRDKILMIGGKHDDGSTNVKMDPGPVYEMDPQTGKWTDTGLQTPFPANVFYVMVYNES